MLQHSGSPFRPSDGGHACDNDDNGAPQIRRSIDGDVSHLWLSGDIDTAVVQPLLSIVADEPRCGTCRVHTDEVTFIDCAGVGALGSLQRHIVDHDAIFELARPGPPVARLLQLIDPDDALFNRPATHTESPGGSSDGISQTICGSVEPIGAANGEWLAVCDVHHWHSVTHRSQQQAQLDLTVHRANATTPTA